MFVQQPQYMYPGAQGGMVLIQPSGAVTAMPQGYPVAGQQAVYIPTSQVIIIAQYYYYCHLQLYVYFKPCFGGL